MKLVAAMMLALALLPAPVARAEESAAADAAFERGYEQLFGEGATPASKVSARSTLEKASALGSAAATNLLGVVYLNGIEVEPDRARALDYFERAAAAGDVSAKLNLGAQLTLDPDGHDVARGVDLVKQAYDDPQLRFAAAATLGRLYVFGIGVQQDVPKGVALLQAAEDAGVADGVTLFLLARAYQSGWGGGEVDDVKALRLFERAADAGNPRAAWYAGMFYLNGDAGPKDLARAAERVRQSAEAGDPQGQISRAGMLATGQGVPEDDAAAREWYERAAEQRSAHGMRGLGGMLLTGEGGPEDVLRGWAYLELAADGGDTMAQRMIDQLGLLPTKEQRSEIDDIKAGWLKAYGAPSSDDDL